MVFLTRQGGDKQCLPYKNPVFNMKNFSGEILSSPNLKVIQEPKFNKPNRKSWEHEVEEQFGIWEILDDGFIQAIERWCGDEQEIEIGVKAGQFLLKTWGGSMTSTPSYVVRDDITY